LAALWHALWVDDQVGVAVFTEILPILAVTDRPAADAATAMVEKVTGTLAHEPPAGLDFTTGPMIGEPSDRKMAFMVWQARRSVRIHDYDRSIAILREATSQQGSIHMRQVVAAEALSVANRLIWADGLNNAPVPTTVGLEAAKIATEMFSGSIDVWYSYGVALRNSGCMEEALAAYDEAIALDPAVADIHHSRAIALIHLGRFDDALTAVDQALVLDPSMAHARENKGIILAVLGKFDAALAELGEAALQEPSGSGEGLVWAGAILWHRHDTEQARKRFADAQFRLGNCSPFRRAELQSIADCGLGQPDYAEQRLREELPRLRLGDRSEPRALYSLLSDPLLPGIERIRAMVDTAS
jgi:tetratricopeptide (TPR) repeat protein